MTANIKTTPLQSHYVTVIYSLNYQYNNPNTEIDLTRFHCLHGIHTKLFVCVCVCMRACAHILYDPSIIANHPSVHPNVLTYNESRDINVHLGQTISEKLLTLHNFEN